MAPELVEQKSMREEIVHWVCDGLGYCAFTSSGRGINIVRSASVQPAIASEADYFTYLWIESLQGFFLARQRMIESSGQGWWLVQELTPQSSYQFFYMFQDDIQTHLEMLEARLDENHADVSSEG